MVIVLHIMTDIVVGSEIDWILIASHHRTRQCRRSRDGSIVHNRLTEIISKIPGRIVVGFVEGRGGDASSVTFAIIVETFESRNAQARDLKGGATTRFSDAHAAV